MKIAIAQINTKAGDIDGNFNKIFQAYNSARLMAADLVVFPELTLTGYPPEDLLLRPAFLDQAEIALRDFAKMTTRCAAIVGTAARRPSDGKCVNAAVVCSAGEVRYEYHKHHLPNYAVFDEKRYFERGYTKGLAVIAGKKVGISICEDAWVKDSPMYSQAADGADFLVNLSASPYSIDRITERGILISTIAGDVGKPIVYANLIGGQDELVFDGGSFVVDSSGVPITIVPQFCEDLVLVDLALGDPELDDIGPTAGPVLGPHEEVYNALVLGTRDYVQKNGFHRVLIGLSGGVDSALVAAIAVEALGPDNVIGVLMPSRFSSPGSITDAAALAKTLGIQTYDLPIEAPHMAFEGLLKPAYRSLFPLSTEGVAEENLQARIRGTLLMALSNRSGAMVLTTGNKSEMAMGYATLYGDMAGGFAVIKDVPKTLVYKICDWLNSVEPVIPQTILDKPPSAELRPDQRDTDSLPDYNTLDLIINMYVEKDMSPEEIFDPVSDLCPPLATIQKICRAIDRNEYKRRQAPPGVRVTSKAFGKDRRLPIANGWHG